MKIFWSDHDPRSRSWSRQYQSAFYAHNEAQLQLALAERERLLGQSTREIHTVIEPLNRFYIAEDYHQKHYLQQFPILMREFEAYFNYFSDFNDSAAAAKVNGFASGRGTRSQLIHILPKLNLSAAAEKLLMDRSSRT
jgi:peptide-methionine (S)-S-oxide reductase